MEIKLKTQPFLGKYIEQNLNSFILYYDREHHLVSVHHNLPFDSIYYDKQELSIKVNSCWSEVLIMETNNLDLTDININYNIQNKLPQEGDVLCIKTSTGRYQTLCIGYDFIPFDNINEDLKLPYIKSKLEGKIDNFLGLSGSPVYIDDKLIGVFSKFDSKESIAYIIPIYIIIKNIIKKDNTNIYELPLKNKINKINSNNVKNSMIYHNTLKTNVPINTFFIIEGDVNTRFSVRYDMTNIIIIHMMTKKVKLCITNESYIVNKNLEYKVNPRLLNLLKKFNINKQIIISLFNHITTSSSPTLFIVKNNEIKLI